MPRRNAGFLASCDVASGTSGSLEHSRIPVAVFITIIVLGWMWGVIGALVAVPALASLKIVCERVGLLHPVAEFLSP
jgi:hypothetical protein